MQPTDGFYKWLGEFSSLAQWLEQHVSGLLEQSAAEPTFSDHSVRHSRRVIENCLTVVRDRADLTPEELFVLAGAALLHDVSLASSGGALSEMQKQHGWYEASLRRDHGAYAADWIRQDLLRALSDSSVAEGARQNSDLIEGVARICAFHTQRMDLPGLEPLPLGRRLSRLPFLAHVFVLADSLDATRERVRVAEVLRAADPVAAKRHWLLRASVEAFELAEDQLTLAVEVPQRASRQEFRRSVLRPLVQETRSLLVMARPVFRRYSVRPLSTVVRVRLVTTDEPSDAARIVQDSGILNRRMARRVAEAERRMDSRAFGKGVLETGLVGDEFHVLRRWGSSTHRLFAGRQGLQRGGGYFLAWNGAGLLIDPGYDLIANAFSMRHLRFAVGDFHAVLITHAHDDHSHDLEPLVSLQYRLRRGSIPGAKARFPTFPVLCAEGVLRKYAPICASNAFVSFLPLVPTENSRRVVAVLPDGAHPDPVLAAAGLSVEALLSFHGESPWHLNNTGVVTKVQGVSGERSFCLGYTSDTSFDPSVVGFLEDADVVLLHLGNRCRGASLYPPHHLGEGGCIDLISYLKFRRPRLFLLAEFGADEFIARGGDDRIAYTAYIEHMAGVLLTGKRVLPADIGLRVRLSDMAIWCEDPPVRRGCPTGDNPLGGWLPTAAVIPVLARGHEIHYTH